jgi:hypothetical protein
MKRMKIMCVQEGWCTWEGEDIKLHVVLPLVYSPPRPENSWAEEPMYERSHEKKGDAPADSSSKLLHEDWSTKAAELNYLRSLALREAIF